jgi:DNA-binding response OmpR family regulator
VLAAPRARAIWVGPVMKILVIDDDERMRRLIERTLSQGGYQVVVAADGETGMRLFRKEMPELVITDIIMPRQEGLGTLMMMRRERPEIKVIAVSGGGRVGSFDVLDAATNLGADDVIAKPFRPEELLDCVNRVAAAPEPATDAAHPHWRDSGEGLRWIAEMSRNRRSSS